MQLQTYEHQDILNSLTRAGVASELQLVKRKGWVFIRVKDKSFAFHRKKVTTLENGRFFDSYVYFVNYPQAPVKVEGWEKVIDKLEEWLNQNRMLE